MSLQVCFYLIVCFINICFSQDAVDLPEVETPLGKIRGSWKQSFDGRRFAGFEGIPYAKPPVGDLRFEVPQPVEAWTEVRIAAKNYSCLQTSMMQTREIIGQEDCLYLNVFVPEEQIDVTQEYDVLVLIHGGAFMMGNAHTMADPRIMMDRDIIVVTINYRVGILGFLSTGDEVIPGNNGLKDQVAALKWVKENIASFGGNPNSVTIAGLSAGGASVHLHYFSPLSKGLFVRGLAQSGTALDPWVIRKNPLDAARQLAELVECNGTSSKEIKECLKEIPIKRFVENTKHFFGYGVMPFSPFAPVIETKSENAFLTEDPYVLLKQKKVLDVPLITSNTADEGLLPTGTYGRKLADIDKEWSNISHYVLDYNYTLPTSKRHEVAQKIRDFYLGPEEHINEDNLKKLTQIFTDRLFTVGGELAAKLQAKATTSPVYYYHFNYRKGENRASFVLQSGKYFEGVCHGEDGIYFYGFLLRKPFSKRDVVLKNACQDILYSYVTTGKPFVNGTTWKPTGYSHLTYLNITNPKKMKLQQKETLSPISFWSDLGLLEYDNLIVRDEL